jgi:3-oxoacyl-[acyl-carrier protein] reductase
MLAQICGVDILINNAGIAQVKQFTDITEADWETIISVNLKSVYLCTQGVIPHMIRNKRGKLLIFHRSGA